MRWFYFLLTFAGLFFFQRFASTLAGTIANLFNYNDLDSDHVFMNVSVHHIIQMIIALTAIYFVGKKFKLQFNLKFVFSKSGIAYTLIFCVVICIYVLLSYFIGYNAGTIQAYDYPLSPSNIVGTLGFQLFLSGPSEEILFRALPITIFLSMFKSSASNRKNAIAILLSCALFSLAHISLNFTVLVFDWFQLVYAFILGAAYAVTYIKSKSIVYPMIMHSMSNVLMVGIGYLFMVFH